MSQAALLIRQARKRARLSQAQLAERMGTAQPAVARIERAGSNPTVATLEDALRAAGYRLEIRRITRPTPSDDGQIRERLRLTPAERLDTFEASARDVRSLVAGARRV
jgi:transcriptional regulator with XRE-family HTH domain